MKGKWLLSDGRTVERDQLGKLGNGILVDFSPLKEGKASVKTLREDGRWVEAGDITGTGKKEFTPLKDSEIQKLLHRGIIKSIENGG